MNRAYRLIPFLCGEQGTSDLSALDENLTVISKKVGYHQERACVFFKLTYDKFIGVCKISGAVFVWCFVFSLYYKA